MIIKRNRPPKASPGRRIIKRNRPAVGEVIGKTIVKRHRGVVVGGPPERPRGPRGPRFHRPGFSWRPSKALLWTAATAATLAAAVYGGYWVWTSPFFKVSDIQVVGNQRISNTTVVEAVDLLGESMFDADLAAAQEALYAQPLVNSVKIERDWPHSIRIVVEERKAWGTWEQSGVRYTIDREGVVLGVGAAPEGSPVIKSSEPGNRITGDHVDYQAVDATAEIYEKLPRQLGTTVAEVAFITGKGVQVTTTNNQTALFGDSSSIPYKLSVWAALQSEAQAQRINYTTIDLRYGNRPVLQ
ncbi:MAG: FtsQ-type POTRA domain-containing protein [Dehalococcoidia bacterium]|uniref:cell division protein FtsQ/DivIB n=1 Tax=Candidatus Amarobacter glycogenicus TaxID=3140699 RepID=UPI002A0CBE20|nr:FtsQ-type POTRA domain-containing protein [Dehalococcoidia bacterium]MBK8558402.1 FtsQ-type POTRA domain-containing protein [Dehalococcoidia bacterium]MBK9612085.1 FtsQ-type POTRA domain-containing protein [Dehalococcoidia bacterium]